jgi:hypothetical protein
VQLAMLEYGRERFAAREWLGGDQSLQSGVGQLGLSERQSPFADEPRCEPGGPAG